MIAAGRRLETALAARSGLAVARYPTAKAALGPHEMSIGGRKDAVRAPRAVNHDSHFSGPRCDYCPICWTVTMNSLEQSLVNPTDKSVSMNRPLPNQLFQAPSGYLSIYTIALSWN